MYCVAELTDQPITCVGVGVLVGAGTWVGAGVAVGIRDTCGSSSGVKSGAMIAVGLPRKIQPIKAAITKLDNQQ